MNFGVSHMEGPGEVTILLSACSYPRTDSDQTREADLVENCAWIRKSFPKNRIIVVDSGLRSPSQIANTTIIHNRASFLPNPSLGEVTNLIEGLKLVSPETRILKLHSRCKLINTGKLIKLISNSPEFVLLNRNIWASSPSAYDRLPYVDTRVFCLRQDRLSRLLSGTLQLLERNGGLMERALFASIIESPIDCDVIKDSGHFYPILSGFAGHGKNYSSVRSRFRARLKSYIFRFGL